MAARRQLDSWADDPRVAAAEREFVEAVDLGNELLLANTLGGAVEGGVAPAGLTRAYGQARGRFRAALGEIDTTDLSAADADAVREMAATADWVDENAGLGGGADPEPEDEMASLRRTTVGALSAARARIPFGGETLDWLGVLGRLTTEQDREVRRGLFMALEGVWSATAGDGGPTSAYRRLLRDASARRQDEDAPVRAAARTLGFEGPVEPVLRAVLHAWRDATAGEGAIEPWDLRSVGGSAARALDPLIPKDRLLDIAMGHVRSLGADPDALGIRHDVFDRPGRPLVPLAFAISRRMVVRSRGRWRRGEHWLLATYRRGGTTSLAELIHETGHAVHFAAVRTRPALYMRNADSAWIESFADVLAWDLTEPWFQRRWLGAEVPLPEARRLRYESVVLDVAWALFEVLMLGAPDSHPNEVWATIMESDLGVAGHREWAWWAGRVQLVLEPGYMINYALGAIVTAAVRDALERRASEWRHDNDRSGWYAFVSRELLRFGGSRPPADVLREFIGSPIGAQAIETDIALCRD